MIRIWQYQWNWPICDNIYQSDPYVWISIKLTCMWQNQSNWLITVKIRCNIWHHGVITTLKLEWMAHHGVIYYTNECDTHNSFLQWYLSISVKLACMWQYQSNWLMCVSISQTDSYVSMSVKLIRMWQNQSNWPVCGNISQTDSYVSISV